jgi:hypothetical protein
MSRRSTGSRILTLGGLPARLGKLSCPIKKLSIPVRLVRGSKTSFLCGFPDRLGDGVAAGLEYRSAPSPYLLDMATGSSPPHRRVQYKYRAVLAARPRDEDRHIRRRWRDDARRHKVW